MSVTISGMRSTSIFPVSNGGTGQSDLASGSLLVGNGADAIASIAPGTNGQVLTVVSGVWAPANSVGGAGGLSTVNTTGNLEGDGSSGSPVALKNNISLTSVTASFSGSGTGLTNIPNSALQNSTITINGTAVPLGGSHTIVVSQGLSVSIDNTKETYTAITGSGIIVGNLVAFSGSIVKADYSDELKSNVIGVVEEVSGNDITVKLIGQKTATSASLYPNIGTPVYVGPSGSVVDFSSIPSGKYITQAGFISDSGKIFIQPRVFGIKG